MNKLENEMNRVMQRWIVDLRGDENGNWSVRVDDGSEYGGELVATVYGLALAEIIVAEHNTLRAR